MSAVSNRPISSEIWEARDPIMSDLVRIVVEEIDRAAGNTGRNTRA